MLGRIHLFIIFKAQFLNMDWCKSFEQGERGEVRTNANALSFGQPSAFLASYSSVANEAKKDW
jgi:hypothetical protein